MADRLIATNQSSFIRGRYILESVVVAHELVHSAHVFMESGFILKLDFEKAYDRVDWSFLFDVVTSRGSCPTWIRWIEQLVKGVSLGIYLNGEAPISNLLRV